MPQWYYPASALFNILVTLASGIYVLFFTKKNLFTKVFVFFASSFAFWSVGYFFWQISNNAEAALFWTRVLMLGAIFIGVSFFHFVLSFLDFISKSSEVQRHNKKALIFAYCCAFCFAIADFTPFFVKSVEPRLSFQFWPTTGFLYHPFLFLFFMSVIYSHYLLFREYRNFSGLLRNQIKYVFLGTLIGFGGGITNYFLWYNIPVAPYGNIIASFIIFACAYSLKNNLLDIKVVVTRWFIFGFVYLILLGSPFVLITFERNFVIQLFGWNWKYFYTLLVMSLSISAPLVYNYFRRKAEDALLKDQRQIHKNLRNISKQLIFIRNQVELQDFAISSIATAMKVKNANFFKHNRELSLYNIIASVGTPWDLIFKEDDSLAQILIDNKLPILIDTIRKFYNTEEASKRLKDKDIVLVIPLFIHDELLGFIVLGEKQNKQIYTADDLDILGTLANQISLAMENAEFYDKMKEEEAHEIQRCKLMSLGEMAAGFAHQINNPLGVIMSGADVLKLKVKKTIGRIEDAKLFNKSMLDEVMNITSDSVQSIKDMTFRITNIIDGIRGYTKPSEFEKLNVKDIIEHGLSMIPEKKFNAAGEIQLVRDIADDLPDVFVKALDIQQVIMNLAINALEAMQPKGKGVLTIEAEVCKRKEGFVEIKVKDTGCGIPKEDIQKIFELFYTTKGSQGTGLGISLVYKMLKENGGDVEVGSEVGKGSTFKVYIPAWSEEREKGKETEPEEAVT